MTELVEYGDEYEKLSPVKEPKWRVKMLLTKLESDRRNGTDYFSHKFVGKSKRYFQARRLCAAENIQRADLTAIEEIKALAELVDASLLLEYGVEYEKLSPVQEPKWRGNQSASSPVLRLVNSR